MGEEHQDETKDHGEERSQNWKPIKNFKFLCS